MVISQNVLFLYYLAENAPPLFNSCAATEKNE